jgi:hypothetical protein
MAREVVLTACHHTETSFEYLKMRTPKGLAVRDWHEVWLATQVNILPRAVSGCVRRSSFMRRSYALKALSKMSWKLEDEEEVG